MGFQLGDFFLQSMIWNSSCCWWASRAVSVVSRHEQILPCTPELKFLRNCVGAIGSAARACQIKRKQTKDNHLGLYKGPKAHCFFTYIRSYLQHHYKDIVAMVTSTFPLQHRRAWLESAPCPKNKKPINPHAALHVWVM